MQKLLLSFIPKFPKSLIGHKSPIKSMTEDADRKVYVFWDVEDYPIPNGLDPLLMKEKIVSALRENGCNGEVSMWAYCEDNSFSDELERQYSDAGIILYPGCTEYGRNCAALVDIALCKVDKEPYLCFILSKSLHNVEYRLQCYHWDNYDFRFPEESDWVYLKYSSASSSAAYLAKLFDGETPSESSQCLANKKQKIAHI